MTYTDCRLGCRALVHVDSVEAHERVCTKRPNGDSFEAIHTTEMRTPPPLPTRPDSLDEEWEEHWFTDLRDWRKHNCAVAEEQRLYTLALERALADANGEREVLAARCEENAKGSVRLQQHRDAWRSYVYGRGPRPQDFLDGNMAHGDRGLTRIEVLESESASLKSKLATSEAQVEYGMKTLDGFLAGQRADAESIRRLEWERNDWQGKHAAMQLDRDVNRDERSKLVLALEGAWGHGKNLEAERDGLKSKLAEVERWWKAAEQSEGVLAMERNTLRDANTKLTSRVAELEAERMEHNARVAELAKELRVPPSGHKNWFDEIERADPKAVAAIKANPRIAHLYHHARIWAEANYDRRKMFDAAEKQLSSCMAAAESAVPREVVLFAIEQMCDEALALGHQGVTEVAWTPEECLKAAFERVSARAGSSGNE